MTTKIVIVSHPDCSDSQFEPRNGPWLALTKELKPHEKDVKGCRKLLATSEDHIQRFVKKMSAHLSTDITVCDCLLEKGDYDCVDDFIVEGIGLLVVIATRDVAESLSSHLVAMDVKRSVTHTRKMEMAPIRMYTI